MVNVQLDTDDLELVGHLLWAHVSLLKSQIEDCKKAFFQARTDQEMNACEEAEFRRREELFHTMNLSDRFEKLLGEANAQG